MGCGDVLRSPWMVVVSAFVIQVYSVGIEYTFGILLVEIDKEFDNQKANWIGSIQLMCYYLMGMYYTAVPVEANKKVTHSSDCSLQKSLTVATAH